MIKKNELKNVFSNLLEAYDEYDSIILSISFSNEEGKRNSYFGGIRFIKKNIILSIINVSQSELRNWRDTLKEFNIEYIFIDIEKKLPFEFSLNPENEKTNIEYSNIYAEATKSLKFAKIIPWSSTEMTSRAAIKVLREELGNNLSGNEISIIGLGAIGFQLSLSLIREGVKISCFTRNYTKGLIKANSINTIKSEYTLASFNLYQSLKTTILSSSVLLECSSSINAINKTYIDDFQIHKLILDIGKQAFTRDFIEGISIFDIKFKRLDISNTLCEFICSEIYPFNIYKSKPAKVTLKSNINLISGGWKGLPGDIVVDDAYAPRFVLGVINSKFSIIPIYTSFKNWENSN